MNFTFDSAVSLFYYIQTLVFDTFLATAVEQWLLGYGNTTLTDHSTEVTSDTRTGRNTSGNVLSCNIFDYWWVWGCVPLNIYYNYSCCGVPQGSILGPCVFFMYLQLTLQLHTTFFFFLFRKSNSLTVWLIGFLLMLPFHTIVFSRLVIWLLLPFWPLVVQTLQWPGKESKNETK